MKLNEASQIEEDTRCENIFIDGVVEIRKIEQVL